MHILPPVHLEMSNICLRVVPRNRQLPCTADLGKRGEHKDTIRAAGMRSLIDETRHSATHDGAHRLQTADPGPLVFLSCAKDRQLVQELSLT